MRSRASVVRCSTIKASSNSNFPIVRLTFFIFLLYTGDMKKHQRSRTDKMDELSKEIDEATHVLERLTQESEELVQSQSLRRRFYGAIVQSLGVLVALAILVPFIISVLQRVQWVPILGDTITQIIERVKTQQRLGGSVDGR